MPSACRFCKAPFAGPRQRRYCWTSECTRKRERQRNVERGRVRGRRYGASWDEGAQAWLVALPGGTFHVDSLDEVFLAVRGAD